MGNTRKLVHSSWLILASVLFVLVSFHAFSVDAETQKQSRSSVEQQVKSDIETLIGHCKANEIEKAAGYVVYRGRDKARRWKAVSDATKMEDRIRVESACRQINEVASKASKLNWLGYSTERESEGTFHIWKIQFDGPTKHKVLFAMLKIKGRFALADMDSM